MSPPTWKHIKGANMGSKKRRSIRRKVKRTCGRCFFYQADEFRCLIFDDTIESEQLNDPDSDMRSKCRNHGEYYTHFQSDYDPIEMVRLRREIRLETSDRTMRYLAFWVQLVRAFIMLLTFIILYLL
jgi:hypothetical protein